MSSDDLNSILELGWQSSREAWQLLAPNDDGEFTATGASLTGRAMDQLAYGLRRIGHVKPARLAYSAAFVLNNLADGTIGFEPEIAEKTSQIVTVLAEMLLELEASKEITTQEPIEIVEDLKVSWGLRFVADEADSIPTEPLDEPPEPAMPTPDEDDLIAVSQELVQASGSLLDRVIQEGVFPHTAALGRIHYLATYVRDHVVTEPLTHWTADSSGYSEELRQDERIPTPSLPLPYDSPNQIPLPAIEMTVRPQFEEVIAGLPPGVMIVDQSPFIRMLLTTAIKAAGYAAMATADLVGTFESEQTRPWHVVICGIGDLTEAERQLLASYATSWQACVITFDECNIGGIASEHYQFRRSDLEGLLNLIKSKLGPTTQPLLMSA